MPGRSAAMITVLSVAYPFAPVSRDAVGGAEQILAQVDAALVRAGHRSIILASEGSLTAGELVSISVPEGPLVPETCRMVQRQVGEKIKEILRENHIDAIHFHGADVFEYLPSVPLPLIITLH